jgi:hypothetical protein
VVLLIRCHAIESVQLNSKTAVRIVPYTHIRGPKSFGALKKIRQRKYCYFLYALLSEESSSEVSSESSSEEWALLVSSLTFLGLLVVLVLLVSVLES